jgi:glycosyl transferase family 25
MSLNDFFDKIYCINLDRRPDRWEASQREFDRIGIEVERFSAVDGANPDTSFVADTGLLPGEYGILDTHGSLLFTARDKGYESILILEDDIEFSPTFDKDWEAWHQEIPADWEMLYLGGNLVGWNPSPVTKHVHKGEGLFAIHAFALAGAALREIPLFLTQGPVDLQYARQSVNYKSYIMVPRMAFQREDYSDIQNAPANYQFLKQGQFPEVMGG